MTPVVRHRLKVGGVGISPKYPPLGATQAPVGLFISVNDGELVFQVVSQHPLIRGDPGRVGAGVQGLDSQQEGLFALSKVPAKVSPPKPS